MKTEKLERKNAPEKLKQRQELRKKEADRLGHQEKVNK
jgi:hypothetical protein